mgnify:FL=1
MNRTSTRKDPLLNTETYTYDNNGNLATLLDRKSQTTTYTYDPLNRRTKATFQDGASTNYTYDAGNRITQVQEKNSGGTVTATITRVYDGLDRLTQEVTAQETVNYTYDNANDTAGAISLSEGSRVKEPVKGRRQAAVSPLICDSLKA